MKPRAASGGVRDRAPAGSRAEPRRGPGQSPGGVRGRAPAGCGVEPREFCEQFDLIQRLKFIYATYMRAWRDAPYNTMRIYIYIPLPVHSNIPIV